jgi:hypothetical protein
MFSYKYLPATLCLRNTSEPSVGASDFFEAEEFKDFVVARIISERFHWAIGVFMFNNCYQRYTYSIHPGLKTSVFQVFSVVL